MVAAHCTQVRVAYRHAKADYEGKVNGDEPRAFAFDFVPTATRTSRMRQANTATAYRMTCFHY